MTSALGRFAMLVAAFAMVLAGVGLGDRVAAWWGWSEFRTLAWLIGGFACLEAARRLEAELDRRRS